MRHHVRGVFGVTLLAPYISGIFLTIYTEIDHPRIANWSELGSYLAYLLLKLLLGPIIFGTIGLILAGLPLLLATAVTAAMLHGLRLRSLTSSACAGLLLGGLFGTYMTSEGSTLDW